MIPSAPPHALRDAAASVGTFQVPGDEGVCSYNYTGWLTAGRQGYDISIAPEVDTTRAAKQGRPFGLCCCDVGGHPPRAVAEGRRVLVKRSLEAGGRRRHHFALTQGSCGPAAGPSSQHSRVLSHTCP